MSDEKQMLEELSQREYKWGFVTDIESDTVPPGLNEEVIHFISAKKEEPAWLLEWRPSDWFQSSARSRASSYRGPTTRSVS